MRFNALFNLLEPPYTSQWMHDLADIWILSSLALNLEHVNSYLQVGRWAFVMACAPRNGHNSDVLIWHRDMLIEALINPSSVYEETTIT